MYYEKIYLNKMICTLKSKHQAHDISEPCYQSCNTPCCAEHVADQKN